MTAQVEHSRRAASRGGLTVLEFIGCAMAVVGGLWLGAIYLGVDVRHVAHTALVQSDMLEKVPPQWRPAGPDDHSMTREQLVATLREELGTLRHEIATLHNPNAAPPVAASSEERQLAADRGGSAGAAGDAAASSAGETLNYWKRLNEIAIGELALQQDADTAFDDGHAARVFAIKGRISRFAARAVEAIPTNHVDPTVVQFSRQLVDWYERSGKLYDEAFQIWEVPAGSQVRARLTESWNQTERHHRNTARLMRERAKVVATTLGRTYGQEFAPFAEPPAEAAASDGADAAEADETAG